MNGHSKSYLEAFSFVREIAGVILKLPKKYRKIALANLELKFGLLDKTSKNYSALGNPLNKILVGLSNAHESRGITSVRFGELSDRAIKLVETLHSMN